MFDVVVFFFKQKTAYEMRISDWSSDVCSSDLDGSAFGQEAARRDHGRQSLPGRYPAARRFLSARPARPRQHRRRNDSAGADQRGVRQDEEGRRRAAGDRVRPVQLDAQTAFSGTVAPEGAAVLDEAKFTAWMATDGQRMTGPLDRGELVRGHTTPH